MEPAELSNPPSSGSHQLRNVTSQPNPRKRTYPSESTLSLAKPNTDSEVSKQDLPNDEQYGTSLRRKRSRINEWPLKNTIDSGDSPRKSPEGIRGKRKSSREQPKIRNLRKRISRFQEGSLNDKPSKQPPAAFIGAEDAMEKYHSHSQRDIEDQESFNAGIEETRPSITFGFGRFGKAVASVFSGFWKEKEPLGPSTTLAEMDNRKAKAEDAYAVLKAQGFKGTKPPDEQHVQKDLLNERRVAAYHDQENSKRDTHHELDKSQPRPTTESRRSQASDRLQPSSVTAPRRSASPGSAITTGRRSSSLHLRTPSFQSLKKIKSQVHLPSISRSTDKVPDHFDQEDKPFELAAHGLTRQPSKRDLAKHDRLSKKVSNLESKLDAARRDLEKSMKGAPPVPGVPASHARKAFTPGTLASLPSESLLTTQTTSAPIAQSNSEIYGPTLGSAEVHSLSSPSRQLRDEFETSYNHPSTKSVRAIDMLMSSEPISTPYARGINRACMDAAQAAKSRRNSSVQFSKQRPSVEAKRHSGDGKHQRRIVPKAPENSPVQTNEAPPPLPKVSIAVDDIDRPRSESPFLGRPATTSAMRTRSKNHKRKTSPSLNTSASKNRRMKTNFSIYDDELATPLTPDSAAGNRQRGPIAKGSPAPRAVQIKAARAKAVKVSLEKGRLDKPLPKLQNEEEFEWDEDIF